MTYLEKVHDHCYILKLYVQPGAKMTGAVGVHDERLKIKLNAPPVDGKANGELIKYLQKTFNTKMIFLTQGERSRQKDIRIEGLELEDIKASLAKSATR